MEPPGVLHARSPAELVLRLGEVVDRSIAVDAGSIWVYVMETDQGIRIAGLRELTAWLDEHEASPVNDPIEAGHVVDDLLHGKILEWGRSNDELGSSSPGPLD